MRRTPRLSASLVRAGLTAATVTVLLGAGFSAAKAATTPVTFDPGIVVATQPQFTADKLNLLDYSRVDLSGSSFNETGYLQVNNASLNNNTFDPTGNRSAYSLYLQFNATGTQSSSSFQSASTGTINTLTYTLYEAPGATQFGIVNNTPTATGAAGTVLATGTLVPGTGTTYFAGVGPNGPNGAGANAQASFGQALAGFIVSPSNATLTLASAFNNDANIINVFNNNSSFTLNGGGGDLTFTATPIPTPEPASLALIGSGLVGIGMVRRKRRS